MRSLNTSYKLHVHVLCLSGNFFRIFHIKFASIGAVCAKVFRINPEFRILSQPQNVHGKSTSKY